MWLLCAEGFRIACGSSCKAQCDIKTAPMNYTVLIPLLFIVGLIVYKWNAAGVAIERVRASGILSTRTDVVAFGGQAAFTAAERTFNYFVVIWPALVFGILISAGAPNGAAAALVLAGLIWAVAVFGGLILNQIGS